MYLHTDNEDIYEKHVLLTYYSALRGYFLFLFLNLHVVKWKVVLGVFNIGGK